VIFIIGVCWKNYLLYVVSSVNKLSFIHRVIEVSRFITPVLRKRWLLEVAGSGAQWSNFIYSSVQFSSLRQNSFWELHSTTTSSDVVWSSTFGQTDSEVQQRAGDPVQNQSLWTSVWGMEKWSSRSIN